MSFRDVRSVLADPADRARALRQTVPYVLLATAALAFGSGRADWGTPIWAHPIVFLAVMLLLRFYFVAGFIRHPPTKSQTFVRLAMVWGVLIASFLIVYFVVLR